MSAERAEGFAGQPPRSDFDQRLRQAFMAGKAASVHVAMALTGWADPGPDDLYPANTLRRLEMAARVHFASGCSLLFEDWLAYAADNHLRSLVEIFAHTAWIVGRGLDGAPMDARARALCYELAMHNALLEEIELLEGVASSIEPGSATYGSTASVETGRAELLKLHPPDSCTCKGKGHGFWTVQRVLRAMAEAAPEVKLRVADWMYPLWKYTSRIDHHAGFERMLRFDGERRWIGPAEPWQRVQTFIWLIVVYGSIVGWVAEQYRSDIAEQLVKELGALSGHEAILEVARAHPDKLTLTG